MGPFTLRGRIYLAAHQPGLAENGQVSDRDVTYHRERARAGAAMQVTGATPVAHSAEWAGNCLWNIDETIVPGYRRVAEAVHSKGGSMLAQLAHPGPTEFEGAEVFGASRFFSEISQQVAVEVTHRLLAAVIEQYAAATDRCGRGELDGVEISMAPSRREFLEYIRWHDRQLRTLGVDLRLGATADAATVAALDPDLVVVATGAAAEPTPLRGVDGSVTVVTADRAFDGSVSGKVVVFDAVGNLDGALVAEHLWDEGMDVTLVTSRIHVGEGEGITTLFPMLRRLSEAGIPMVERMRPVGAESGEVVLEGVFGAPPLRIRADYLVTWAGGTPDTTLAEELKRAGHSVIVAGDALRPRRVLNATTDAKERTDTVVPAVAAAVPAHTV